jgi:hypothetical protein
MSFLKKKVFILINIKYKKIKKKCQNFNIMHKFI